MVLEIVGVGIGVVGLAGLVSTCLDVLDKVDTYKNFGAESRSLELCFEADKHRFKKWLLGVGIVNGCLQDEHHQLLDDDSMSQLVVKIVRHICALWSAGGASAAAFDFVNQHDAHAFPGGGDTVGKSRAQKPPSSTLPMVASKRKRMAWALGGKAKFITQLESFGTLVNRLYDLVPPAQFSGGHSGNKLAGPEVHMATEDGKITGLLLLRKLFLTPCQMQP
jgi:hypothetical protein